MGESVDRLAELRAELDAIDSSLIETLAIVLDQRNAVIDEVTAYKHDHGVEVHQPVREGEMMNRLEGEAEKVGLDPDMVRPLWGVILEFSKARQRAKLEGA